MMKKKKYCTVINTEQQQQQQNDQIGSDRERIYQFGSPNNARMRYSNMYQQGQQQPAAISYNTNKLRNTFSPSTHMKYSHMVDERRMHQY